MAKNAVEERPTTRAVVKYIGRSPYKVRHVASLIRGKDAEAAQNELLLCERGAADEVSKLLNSAIANAEHNQQIPAEELRVKEIFVDEGPTMKRFRARARGRGTRIFKRTSHITIILERMTQEDIEAKSQREAGTGAANAREQRRRRAEASKAAQKAKQAADEEVDEDALLETDEVEETEAKVEAPKKVTGKKKAESAEPNAEAKGEEGEELSSGSQKKVPKSKKPAAKKDEKEEEDGE